MRRHRRGLTATAATTLREAIGLKLPHPTSASDLLSRSPSAKPRHAPCDGRRDLNQRNVAARYYCSEGLYDSVRHNVDAARIRLLDKSSRRHKRGTRVMAVRSTPPLRSAGVGIEMTEIAPCIKFYSARRRASHNSPSPLADARNKFVTAARRRKAGCHDDHPSIACVCGRNCPECAQMSRHLPKSRCCQNICCRVKRRSDDVVDQVFGRVRRNGTAVQHA